MSKTLTAEGLRSRGYAESNIISAKLFNSCSLRLKKE